MNKHLLQLRKIIRNNSFAESLLKKILNYLRAKKAREYLKEANAYPADLEKIIRDYKYSIKKDHRGIRQVLNLESAVRFIEDNKIEGCFVETGTFTGGASAYALLALQRISKNTHRDYWGFDSFEGMPVPSAEDGDESFVWLYGRKMSEIDKIAVGQLIGHEMNKADFKECYDYLCGTGYPKEKINLIKGWFQKTIPEKKTEIGPIAVLRLDGDFYDSTLVVLNELFPQVSQNGVIIIDDYGSFSGCKKAVDSFLKENNIRCKPIYIENGIRMLIK
jgi:hypothetical protein